MKRRGRGNDCPEDQALEDTENCHEEQPGNELICTGLREPAEVPGIEKSAQNDAGEPEPDHSDREPEEDRGGRTCAPEVRRSRVRARVPGRAGPPAARVGMKHPGSVVFQMSEPVPFPGKAEEEAPTAVPSSRLRRRVSGCCSNEPPMSTNVDEPSPIRSPSAMTVGPVILAPLTKVPLDEPRSSIWSRSPARNIRA